MRQEAIRRAEENGFRVSLSLNGGGVIGHALLIVCAPGVGEEEEQGDACHAGERREAARQRRWAHPAAADESAGEPYARAACVTPLAAFGRSLSCLLLRCFTPLRGLVAAGVRRGACSLH